MTEVLSKRNPWKALVAGVSKDGRTARVEVRRMVQHSKYGKRLVRSTTLHVETSGRPVEAGNEVEILPCRKVASSKAWRIVAVVNKA